MYSCSTVQNCVCCAPLFLCPVACRHICCACLPGTGMPSYSSVMAVPLRMGDWGSCMSMGRRQCTCRFTMFIHGATPTYCVKSMNNNAISLVIMLQLAATCSSRLLCCMQQGWIASSKLHLGGMHAQLS